MTTADAIQAALALVLIAVLSWAAARALPWGVAVLPLSSRRREDAMRWVPAVHLALTAVMVVAGALLLFGPITAAWAATAVVVLTTGAAWFAVRDVMAGIVLRAEHGFQPGHRIHCDEGAGIIRGAGARSLLIESEHGEQLHLPYSRLQAARIALQRPTSGTAAVRFSLTLPATGSVRDDAATIRAAALHAACSSTTREPQVRVTQESDSQRTWEVTVHAADPSYLPVIEAAVRAQLGRAPIPTA